MKASLFAPMSHSFTSCILFVQNSVCYPGSSSLINLHKPCEPLQNSFPAIAVLEFQVIANGIGEKNIIVHLFEPQITHELLRGIALPSAYCLSARSPMPPWPHAVFHPREALGKSKERIHLDLEIWCLKMIIMGRINQNITIMDEHGKSIRLLKLTYVHFSYLIGEVWNQKKIKHLIYRWS